MSSESPLEVASETAANNTPDAAVENASLDTLKPKQELQGVVKRVELQGALVDVGLERDGLLHISQLSTETVKNVSDVLKVGDNVTVYVMAVDKKSGRLDLTMIKPPAVSWNELKENQLYTGTVVRIERFGVFIDIGAERPGLIHVSELTTGYVNDPSEVVKVGDTIEAKLIGVNRRKKQIDLSVKAREIQEREEIVDEDEEELPTAMELALRKAMQGNDNLSFSTKKSQKKRDKRQRTAEQDEIISRTLRMHEK